MAKHLTLAMFLTVLPATLQQFQKNERYCPADQHCYMYITSSLKSWSNAQESCKSLNAVLPIVDSLEKQVKLVEAMENLGLIEVWIGATAVHGNWTWVDGTKCSDCASLSRTIGVSIAGLATYPSSNMQGVVLPFGSGSINSQTYICQYSNPDVCNETGLTAITIEGSCYILYYDVQRWFSARNICLENGGDLATFHNITDARTLLDLSEVPPYVGLRSKWWNWNNAVTGTWKEVLFTQWIWGEPSNTDGFDCVSTTSNGWKGTNCTQKLAFICQEQDTGTLTTELPELSTVHSRSGDEHPVQIASCTNVGLAAGLGVGIPLIVISIVVVVVIVWRNKSRTQKQDSSTAIYDSKSTSNNVPRDTSLQQTQDDRTYEGLDSSQRITADDEAYEALEVSKN